MTQPNPHDHGTEWGIVAVAPRSRAPAPVDALLAIDAVFAPERGGDRVFRDSVAAWHAELAAHGVADVLADVLAGLNRPAAELTRQVQGHP